MKMFFKGEKMERRRDKTERVTIQPEHYADIYFCEVYNSLIVVCDIFLNICIHI